MGSVLNVESTSWFYLRINYTHIITTVKTCKWKCNQTTESTGPTKMFLDSQRMVTWNMFRFRTVRVNLRILVYWPMIYFTDHNTLNTYLCASWKWRLKDSEIDLVYYYRKFVFNSLFNYFVCYEQEVTLNLDFSHV